MTPTELGRFETCVERIPFSTCWIWTGALDKDGYGRMRAGGVQAPAHRHSYRHFVGAIPGGLQLDHLCRQPACVNPLHLEPVTCRENLLRGNTLTAANARKTHCPRGHAYDAENTFTYRGGRRCRACHRVTWRATYHRRAEYYREYARRRHAMLKSPEIEESPL